MNNKIITYLKKYYLLLAFVFVFGSCQGGTGDLDNRQSSSNPFGAQIVVVSPNPDVIFGNLCESVQVEILVNNELTPNGSTVDIELNSTSLTFLHRGCILSEENIITNSSALVNFLSGLFIDETPDDIGENEVATANLGVTITTPDGESESGFVPIVFNPVRLIAPEDFELTSGEPVGPSIFSTLEFLTQGLPPGTIVEFEVSRPDLGDVFPTSVAVDGSTSDGLATTQYTSVNFTGGTQVVTATVILPNPPTKNPICPPVPVADRTVTAVVVITQAIPDPSAEDECFDGLDNDGDGAIDCGDSDCFMDQVCQPEGDCENGLDDDFDGSADCADADCDGDTCDAGGGMMGTCVGGVCI